MRAKLVSEDGEDTIIDCEIVGRSHNGSAIQVIGVENQLVWLPLSVCEIITERESSWCRTFAKVSVPSWLVAKKPLV